MTISPEKLSPLRFIQYQSLHQLTRVQLVELCMLLTHEAGDKYIKHLDSVKKRGDGKRASHKIKVIDKVREVYVELSRKGIPSPTHMEIALNDKYPEKVWVYDQYAKRNKENNEQGFYRPYLAIKREFGVS